MSQAQNRETMNSTWKVAVSFKINYDNERDKTVFHNTTPDLQDQDQDRNVFGLRPQSSLTSESPETLHRQYVTHFHITLLIIWTHWTVSSLRWRLISTSQCSTDRVTCPRLQFVDFHRWLTYGALKLCSCNKNYNRSTRKAQTSDKAAFNSFNL